MRPLLSGIFNCQPASSSPSRRRSSRPWADRSRSTVSKYAPVNSMVECSTSPPGTMSSKLGRTKSSSTSHLRSRSKTSVIAHTSRMHRRRNIRPGPVFRRRRMSELVVHRSDLVVLAFRMLQPCRRLGPLVFLTRVSWVNVVQFFLREFPPAVPFLPCGSCCFWVRRDSRPPQRFQHTLQVSHREFDVVVLALSGTGFRRQQPATVDFLKVAVRELVAALLVLVHLVVNPEMPPC